MTSDIFDDLFGGFDAMNRRFEALFSDLAKGENVRTYGYTMYQGPDGIPHVYEYGNTAGKNAIGMHNDPVIGIEHNDDTVTVTMEIPGVKKEDISLEGCNDSMTVSVSGPKTFEKTVALPCNVDIDSASATYNNGILEIVMKSVEKKPEGKKIEIA